MMAESAAASPPALPEGQQTGTGTSPLTQPVANRGTQAAALARMGNLVQLMKLASAALPPGSPMSNDFTKAISLIEKHIPEGEQSSGLLKADLQKLQGQQRQQQMQAMQMRQHGAPPQPASPPPQMAAA